MSKIKRFLNSDSGLSMTNGDVIVSLAGLAIAGAGLWINTYVAVKEIDKNTKLKDKLTLVECENKFLERELEIYRNSNNDKK